MRFKITNQFRIDPPPPPMLSRAGNLARSIATVVRSAARGKPIFVSEEERDRRRGICSGEPGGDPCPRYNVKRGVCTHPACGCYMRLKPWLAALECAEGRWVP